MSNCSGRRLGVKGQIRRTHVEHNWSAVLPEADFPSGHLGVRPSLIFRSGPIGREPALVSNFRVNNHGARP